MLKLLYRLQDPSSYGIISADRPLECYLRDDFYNLKIVSRSLFPHILDIYPNADDMSYFSYFISYMYRSVLHERVVKKFVKVFFINDNPVYTIFDPYYMVIEIGGEAFCNIYVDVENMSDFINYFQSQFSDLNFKKVSLSVQLLPFGYRFHRITSYVTKRKELISFSDQEFFKPFTNILLDSYFLNLQH